MKARLLKLLNDVRETFWVLPAAMVLMGIGLGYILVHLDASGVVPKWLLTSSWLYNGDAAGARRLLGSVAGSTIGVAGTVFSITIAALTLAAGQMGPRLLRNFTRDRGNQFTLGVFLGTFCYALMVLRTVRSPDSGEFVPHLALTVSMILAFACVGTLVFFVGHMAGRINVDTVIELVSEDVRYAIRRLTFEEERPAVPSERIWRDAQPVRDGRKGYLQTLQADWLADWAVEHGTQIRLLVKPGGHVFPGTPIALVNPPVEGCEDAIRTATALGDDAASSRDLEFTVRQLVEVAVRALSAGINDPHTAMSVLDRMAVALCDLVPLHLDSGVHLRDGRVVLVQPTVDYDGLTNAMFDRIRQYGAATPGILMRILEVLAAVASYEQSPSRCETLKRHATLAMQDAERNIANQSDLATVRQKREAFDAMMRGGSRTWIGATD